MIELTDQATCEALRARWAKEFMKGRLTPRHAKAALGITERMETAEIAERFGWAENTTRVYICEALRRLGLRNRRQLREWGAKHLAELNALKNAA